MAKTKFNPAPRIENRRAFHDYFIESKLECGIALVGSEVKSLRLGNGQLTDSFATIDHGKLHMHGAYIDPYKQASLVFNHEPKRIRVLLAHRREIKRLEEEISRGGMTLIPLAIYFKDGRAKVELGVARGKKSHDKRASIKEKEAKRDLRNAMMR